MGKSYTDLGSVVEGIRTGAFLDSVDGEVLKRYWKYEPWGDKFQIGFHKSTSRIRAAIAGNRCGKSVCGIMEAFIMATGNVPESMKGWFPSEKVAPSNSILFLGTIKEDMHDEITIPIIEKFIPLNAFGIRYAKSERAYYCPRGIKIFLKSYEAGWETFQGSGVWYVNLDEEPPDRKVYTECLTRILSTGGFISLTFTPLAGYTWSFFDIFEAAKKDDGIKVFRADMRQSPHLNQKDVDDILKKYPEHERRARETGDYTVAIEQHVFDVDRLSEWMSKYVPPLFWRRVSLCGDETNTVRDYLLGVAPDPAESDYLPWSEGVKEHNPSGIWEVWREPKPGYGYVVGADVASGHGFQSDHSVAHIKHVNAGGSIEHCATLRTNCVKPYDFGKMVLCGAMWYNRAMIICEAEGYGDSCLDAFAWYPHQWYSSVYENSAKRTSARRSGFVMKESVRKMVLESERDLISRYPYAIVCERETMREMMNFTFDSNGKYDHPRGGRSDGIIASSLADHVCIKYRNIVHDNNAGAKKASGAGASGGRGFRYPEDDPDKKGGGRPKHIGMSRSKFAR